VKLSSLLLIVAAMLLGGPISAEEMPHARPEAAPISGTSFEHGELSLTDLRGKVVLLQFWASWCPTCLKGLPGIERLYEQHADQGFEIVGISLDEEAKDARRAIAEFNLSWPQLCDGLGKASPLAKGYDVRGTPRYILIDREGRIAAAYVKPSELEQRVRELLHDPSTENGDTE
jgi:thiol-disulfide isomerase/thioredoxin